MRITGQKCRHNFRAYCSVLLSSKSISSSPLAHFAVSVNDVVERTTRQGEQGAGQSPDSSYRQCRRYLSFLGYVASATLHAKVAAKQGRRGGGGGSGRGRVARPSLRVLEAHSQTNLLLLLSFFFFFLAAPPLPSSGFFPRKNPGLRFCYSTPLC